MSDEVREFHLDGKQLAFLVISAIGVAVVVFLCGVMVGRGVRVQGGQAAGIGAEIPNVPLADSTTVDSDLPVATDGISPPADSIAYPERLSGPPAPELLRDPLVSEQAASTPAAAPPVTRTDTTRTDTARTDPGRTDTARTDTARTDPGRTDAVKAPAASGAKPSLRGRFAVQVSSVTDRGVAEQMKRRLEAESFPAFVEETTDAGHRFRVRVGPFADRREAEAVAKKLEREMKFNKPWVAPAR
jgi:DedD protein